MSEEHSEREYVVEVSIDETWATTIHPDDVPPDKTIEEEVEYLFWGNGHGPRDLSMKFADGGVSPGQITIENIHESEWDVRKRHEDALLEQLDEVGGEAEWGDGWFRDFCDENDISIVDDLPEILSSLWRAGEIELVNGGTIRLIEDT